MPTIHNELASESVSTDMRKLALWKFDFRPF